MRWFGRCFITVVLVAFVPTRVVADWTSLWITSISPLTPGKDSKGDSIVCGDSISAESDGVYEDMYTAENMKRKRSCATSLIRRGVRHAGRRMSGRAGAKGSARVVNSFFEGFELLVMRESVGRTVARPIWASGHTHAEGYPKEDAEFGKSLRWAQLLYFSKEAEHVLAFLSLVALGKPRQKDMPQDRSDVLGSTLVNL
ncbi:hypothetical protein BJV78DRAFT_1153857 [Lactifluus subvellereus]|nr:hypothetical protein BJV78DRAFT_1153857 [Lactifluus subvellereus]